MKHFLAFFLIATGLLHAQTKPNVIFILVDDMGWGDLGVFWQNQRGSQPKFATPELDAFAAQGLQLRRHYTAAPVCAPARASLLLGVHQGHANVRNSQFDKALADNHTLGTVMRQADYATAAIGKWGLQGGGGFPAHPLNRGFDYFFGYIAHLDAHYHYPKEQNRAFYEDFNDIRSSLDKCYSTDLITARAKDWIADHRTEHPGQPFFMYLCYAAPHAQLNVPTQAYPAAKGLNGGVQWTGTPGALINTASGAIDTWIHPDYSGQAWSDAAKRHATMMRRVDDGVGDLLATLADLNIDDDTLIVFTSDNGPHNEAGAGGSFTQNPRTFESYGPLEGIKRDLLEGGLRVPALARWPGTIPAGGISQLPSQFHDWLPTFLDVAGMPLPARSDGTSLKPLLTGIGSQRPPLVYSEFSINGSTPNYAEFPNNRGSSRSQMQAIFREGYKGLRTSISDSNTSFRVYDTVADPGEGNDLAGQAGVPSQADFAAAVLRSRRVDSSAPRPYDSALVPAVSVASVSGGLRYQAFEKATPWVPDWSTETAVASGTVASPSVNVRTREADIGLLFTGFLEVPADGNYTFFATTDTGVFVRLHDAQLIDADFGYNGGSEQSSGAISLEAGLHPIRIHYRHGNAASHALTLQWQGPGITQQTIPTSAWKSELILPPGPPEAAPDGPVTVSTGTSVLIDVLANDIDDGTPEPLTITAVTQPSQGSAVIEEGRIRYTSGPGGFTGTDSLTYTISDGAESDSATVTMDVVAQQAPTAEDDLATTTGSASGPGTQVSIPVLENDSDPDDGPSPLQITLAGNPRGGTVVISGSNLLYTPRPGIFGRDTFAYTMGDGAASASATVTVEVTVPGDDYWYPLDEASGLTAYEAGGGKPASLLGFTNEPAQWVPGRVGNALEFDGADDHVSIDGFPGILGTNPRTVSAWIKTTGSGQHPVIAWGPNAGGQKWTFLIQNGNVRLEATGGFRQGSRLVNNGVWRHIACTWENDGTPDVTDAKIYIDGTLETAFNANQSRAINTAAALDVRIGRDVQERSFPGSIDDARIDTRALSAAEIAALAAQSPVENNASRWFFRHFGNANPFAADWNLDPDGDGLSNFGEYALGGSPHWFDPEVQPTLGESPGGVTFSFNRRIAIAPSRYTAEWSNALTPPWNPLTLEPAVPHPWLPGFERLTTEPQEIDSDQRFFRLRIE